MTKIELNKNKKMGDGNSSYNWFSKLKLLK